MARPRRSILQQLNGAAISVSDSGVGSEINTPSTKLAAVGDATTTPASGWSGGVGVVPSPLTTPSPGSLFGSNGRPLLSSRSFDGGMTIDRAQAPVMLQAGKYVCFLVGCIDFIILM